MYPRATGMLDGTGTTSYTYHPDGQLDAGQAATVDGPLTGPAKVASHSSGPRFDVTMVEPMRWRSVSSSLMAVA